MVIFLQVLFYGSPKSCFSFSRYLAFSTEESFSWFFKSERIVSARWELDSTGTPSRNIGGRPWAFRTALYRGSSIARTTSSGRGPPPTWNPSLVLANGPLLSWLGGTPLAPPLLLLPNGDELLFCSTGNPETSIPAWATFFVVVTTASVAAASARNRLLGWQEKDCDARGCNDRSDTNNSRANSASCAHKSLLCILLGFVFVCV